MTLRRALVWVLIAPLLAFALALGALVQAIRASDAADGAEARLQAVLDHRPEEPVLQAAAVLMPGTTAGLASSAFQARVLTLLEGVEVQEIGSTGAEADGPLTRLRLTVHLAGEEASLMQSLIALEAALPLIRVDALRVTADGARLTADLDLSAWAGKVTP